MPRHNDSAVFSIVNKILRDANGILMDTDCNNPIVDSIIYKGEFIDGHNALFRASAIIESLFSKANTEEY